MKERWLDSLHVSTNVPFLSVGRSRSWIAYVVVCRHTSPADCSVGLELSQHCLWLVLRLNNIYSRYGGIEHFCIVHGVFLIHASDSVSYCFMPAVCFLYAKGIALLFRTYLRG